MTGAERQNVSGGPAGVGLVGYWWPVILLAVVVICGFTLYRGFTNFNKVQDELYQVRQTNQRLDAENRALYRKVQRLRGDAKAQELAARKDMGLLRPDEVVYGEATAQAAAAAPLQAGAARPAAQSTRGGE
ncbi:hypothetical protein AAU61_14115 [Desulfocarbo indianensis]|nr:hypothetical protein AAU61_14115 [Desulfocarbo indianensis]